MYARAIINMDNPPFKDGKAPRELAKILRRLAHKVEDYEISETDHGCIEFDSDGEQVAFLEIEP